MVLSCKKIFFIIYNISPETFYKYHSTNKEYLKSTMICIHQFFYTNFKSSIIFAPTHYSTDILFSNFRTKLKAIILPQNFSNLSEFLNSNISILLRIYIDIYRLLFYNFIQFYVVVKCIMFFFSIICYNK